MHKKIKCFVTALALCAVFGWWGVLYPQLTMTKDTYCVVSEDGTVQEGEDVVEWDFEGSVYMDILKAAPENIRFRSGLWKSMAQYLESLKRSVIHASE